MSREKLKEHARQIGLKNRKYEEKCTFCGKEEHYAKGYCRICYARYLRKGHVEYIIPKDRMSIPLNENQINKALRLIYLERRCIFHNHLLTYETLRNWVKGATKPTYKKMKKIFEYLNLDIVKELEIEEKYLNPRKYEV